MSAIADHMTALAGLLKNESAVASLVEATGRDLELGSRLTTALASIVQAFDASVSNSAFDDLSAPREGGPIHRFAAALAAAYGGVAAHYVEAGSSAANVRTALALRRTLAGGRPATVIVDEMAHRSVFGGLAIAGLRYVPLPRTLSAPFGLPEPAAAAAVAAALDASGANAVWITSPTYHGRIAEVAGIAEVCRRRGVPLVVDAAWGAAYGLVEGCGFPASPVELGAAAMIVSFHKKGLGPSQTSAAIFADPDLGDAFRAVGELGCATTSPNYLLAGVAELRVAEARTDAGRKRWMEAVSAARRLAECLDATPGLRVPGIGDPRQDPCHLVVDVSRTGIDGFAIQREMAGLGIDIEMAEADRFLLLFGPGRRRPTAEIHAVIARLVTGRRGSGIGRAALAVPARTGRAIDPAHAFFGPRRTVRLREAVGAVAAVSIGAYPPGYAVIACGDVVTEEAIVFLQDVQAAGGRLKGIGSVGWDDPIEISAGGRP